MEANSISGPGETGEAPNAAGVQNDGNNNESTTMMGETDDRKLNASSKPTPPVLEHADNNSNHQHQQQRQQQFPVPGDHQQQPPRPQQNNESKVAAAASNSDGNVATHSGDNDNEDTSSGAADQDSTKQDDRPKNNHDHDHASSNPTDAPFAVTTQPERFAKQIGDTQKKLEKNQDIVDNASLSKVPEVDAISSSKEQKSTEDSVNPTAPNPLSTNSSGPPAVPAPAPVPGTTPTSLPPTSFSVPQQQKDTMDVADDGDTEMLEANKDDIAESESKSIPMSPIITENTNSNKDKELGSPAAPAPESTTSPLATPASAPTPGHSTSPASLQSPKTSQTTGPFPSPIQAPSPPPTTKESSSLPTSNPAPTNAPAPIPAQAASKNTLSTDSNDIPDDSKKAYPSSGTVKPSQDVMSLLYRLQEAQLALTTAANRRVKKKNQAAGTSSELELPPSQKELLAANASTLQSLQENAKTISYNLQRRKQEAAFASGEDSKKNSSRHASSIPEEEMETTTTNNSKNHSLPNPSTSDSAPPVDHDVAKSLATSDNIEGTETSAPGNPENQSDTDSTPIIVDEELLKSHEVLEPFDVVPAEVPMERLERARKAASYFAQAPPVGEPPKQAESTNLLRAPPKPNQQNNLSFQAAVAAAKGATKGGSSPARITAKTASSTTKASPLKHYTTASKHSSHQRTAQPFPPKYVTHPRNGSNTNSNLRRLPGSSKKETPQGRSPLRPSRTVQHPLPTGPTAPLKPIRRLAKIRPYANQAVAFSQEQILEAIPKDASSVFHIMDRRVNLDSFGNNGLDDPRRDVPIYSLLRAWVQDDPYRQIPPADPDLPHAAKKGIASTRKRHHDHITDNGTANAEPDRKKGRETADVIGQLEVFERQAMLPIPTYQRELLKQEMIQQAKGTKNSKRSEYNKRLTKTLKGLRKRGIVLN